MISISVPECDIADATNRDVTIIESNINNNNRTDEFIESKRHLCAKHRSPSYLRPIKYREVCRYLACANEEYSDSLLQESYSHYEFNEMVDINDKIMIKAHLNKTLPSALMLILYSIKTIIIFLANYSGMLFLLYTLTYLQPDLNPNLRSFILSHPNDGTITNSITPEDAIKVWMDHPEVQIGTEYGFLSFWELRTLWCCSLLEVGAVILLVLCRLWKIVRSKKVMFKDKILKVTRILVEYKSMNSFVMLRYWNPLQFLALLATIRSLVKQQRVPTIIFTLFAYSSTLLLILSSPISFYLKIKRCSIVLQIIRDHISWADILTLVSVYLNLLYLILPQRNSYPALILSHSVKPRKRIPLDIYEKLWEDYWNVLLLDTYGLGQASAYVLADLEPSYNI